MVLGRVGERGRGTVGPQGVPAKETVCGETTGRHSPFVDPTGYIFDFSPWCGRAHAQKELQRANIAVRSGQTGGRGQAWVFRIP